MSVPVEGLVNAGGVTAVVSFKIVRAANATQYTALDVVGSLAVAAPNVLRGCARKEGGTGIIYSALLIDSVDAATNLNFDLVLFDTNILTVAADNAIGTITDAEAEHCVGAITFNGTDASLIATVGPNVIIKATNIGQAFKCADGSKDLYGVVVDRGGYTPASGETFTFRLFILQD
jgi:hypothetical protein